MFAPAVYAASKTWRNCTVNGVPTLGCLEVVFQNVLGAAAGVVIIALFIMLVVGAYTYLTSFGNPEKVKKAQSTFKFAIIGFVLFLSSFLILNAIDYLFLGGHGKLFKFEIGQ